MRASSASGWISALLPERIEKELRLPPDTMLVYQRFAWTTPFDPAATRLAGESWAVDCDGETEQGLWSAASLDGLRSAEMLLVVRHSDPTRSHGSSELPPVPRAGCNRPGRPLVIGEAEILDYVDAVDGHYPSTRDARAAHRRGHPGIIAPGMLVLCEAAAEQLRRPTGMVEAWFRRPIPAGAVLLRASSDDACVQELHLVGRTRPSAVLRYTPDFQPLEFARPQEI